jgi:hypothetical protein
MVPRSQKRDLGHPEVIDYSDEETAVVCAARGHLWVGRPTGQPTGRSMLSICWC